MRSARRSWKVVPAQLRTRHPRWAPFSACPGAVTVAGTATLTNTGAQVDFRFEFLSHLRLTLSVGYAMAFEENRKTSDEYMVSLKLL